MKRLLHTPEGVRDIYNKECAKKTAVQEKLQNIFHLYGYQDIQTPTFEFFDVFREEIGSIPTRELYKFFDREGNILALRPDITPSIARASAALLEDEEMPVRFCYTGNVFINHSSYQGRLKESTQMGAELLGRDSLEADVEMIAMMADGLKSSGLEEFQISIGHVDFLRSLLEETGLEAEQKRELVHLIHNQNYFGVDEMMDEVAVKGSVREDFHVLSELQGSVEVLEKASEIAPSINAQLAVKHLKQMYEMLKIYGVEQYITFDLSMSGNYDYYTGIIFRAFTYGTGDAVIRGGRYDHLMEKFGKQTPSIGFAIMLDELMNALSRQKISVKYDHPMLLVYTEETKEKAIQTAKEFRKKGKSIELMKREPADSMEQYIEYGRRYQVINMLWLENENQLLMKNIVNGNEKTIQY